MKDSHIIYEARGVVLPKVSKCILSQTTFALDIEADRAILSNNHDIYVVDMFSNDQNENNEISF